MYSVQVNVYGSGHDLTDDSFAAAKEYIAKVETDPTYTQIECSVKVFALADTLAKKAARAAKRGRDFDLEAEKAKLIANNVYFDTKEEAIAAGEAALAELLA